MPFFFKYQRKKYPSKIFFYKFHWGNHPTSGAEIFYIYPVRCAFSPSNLINIVDDTWPSYHQKDRNTHSKILLILRLSRWEMTIRPFLYWKMLSTIPSSTQATTKKGNALHCNIRQLHAIHNNKNSHLLIWMRTFCPRYMQPLKMHRFLSNMIRKLWFRSSLFIIY